jgi:hypothetical protein
VQAGVFPEDWACWDQDPLDFSDIDDTVGE